MGYYDDHYQSDEERNRKGGKKSGWFLSGLIGAIVGAVLFLFFTPFLASSGLLPGNGGSANGGGGGSPDVVKQVDVDVTTAVTEAIDKVSPAVVGVINMKRANFFNDEYTKQGIGSGIVYKKEGKYAYVVTNYHVVKGSSKVEVRFANSKKVDAEILGTDSLYDLAVLKIPADPVTTVAEFGNSSDLQRGQPVVAIGNPLGFSGTVTQGIISSGSRRIPKSVPVGGNAQITWLMEVIQTDAAINPGNSGGALINLKGQVIGINSLKIAKTSVEGIGFAIPIDEAEPIIHELETTGKIERPYMGVSIRELSNIPSLSVQRLKVPDNITNGLVVTKVAPGTPAARAGLKPGDVIVSINGHDIKDYAAFTTYLFTELEVDQTVDLTVYRFGEKVQLQMTLGGKTF